VFFNTLFGSVFDLEITVAFYSEHCVLYLLRRETRTGLELQSLAHGEVLPPRRLPSNTRRHKVSQQSTFSNAKVLYVLTAI